MSIPNHIKSKRESIRQQNAYSKKIGFSHLVKDPSPTINCDEDEWLNTLKDHINQQIISMPQDSLFQGTDLIIFNNSYKGHLPLNGIYEKDFQSLTTLITYISEGKTIIQFPKDLPPTLKKAAIANLILLSTRAPGRELLIKVTQQNEVLHLKPHLRDTDNLETLYDSENSTIPFELSDPINTANQPSLSRLEYRSISPSFLGLAHEFIHFIHYHTLKKDQYDAQTTDLSSEYDTKEEERTITGNEINFLDLISNKNNTFDASDEFANFYHFENEWRLFSAFGIPFRENHYLGEGYGPISNNPYEKNIDDETNFFTALKNDLPLEYRYYIKNVSDINKPITKNGLLPIEVALLHNTKAISDIIKHPDSKMTPIDFINQTPEEKKIAKATRRSLKKQKTFSPRKIKK